MFHFASLRYARNVTILPKQAVIHTILPKYPRFGNKIKKINAWEKQPHISEAFILSVSSTLSCIQLSEHIFMLLFQPEFEHPGKTAS